MDESESLEKLNAELARLENQAEILANYSNEFDNPAVAANIRELSQEFEKLQAAVESVVTEKLQTALNLHFKTISELKYASLNLLDSWINLKQSLISPYSNVEFVEMLDKIDDSKVADHYNKLKQLGMTKSQIRNYSHELCTQQNIAAMQSKDLNERSALTAKAMFYLKLLKFESAD